MVKIKAISKYISLAQEGLVDPLECPLDQGLLVPNIDYDDNEYLYCLSCEYKKIIGIEFYEKIYKILKEVENGGK